MPIDITYGEAAAPWAGIAAGLGRALTEERKLEQTKEIAEFQNKLAIERIKANSILDFEAEQRAKAWQIEKMEIASRMDFEQEERERMRRKAEYSAAIKRIDEEQKEGHIEPEAAERLKLNTEREYYGYSPYVKGRGEKVLFDFGRDGISGLAAPTTPGLPTAENPLGLNIQDIPAAKLPETVLALEAENKFRVVSPDGKEEIISATDWPDYKSKGYILAEIHRMRQRARPPEIKAERGML